MALPTRSWLAVAPVLGVLLAQSSAAWPATAPDGQAAVWMPKKLSFVYQGFTTHYSCEGLRDTVKEVLRNLGARKDMQVVATGCSVGAGRPAPFPGVDVKMHVLEPVSATDAGQPVVQAYWKPAELKLGGPGVDRAGQCELVEQIKHSVLPLFTTRNVDYKDNCVPHQLTLGGTQLKAEVLMAAQAGAGNAAVP